MAHPDSSAAPLLRISGLNVSYQSFAAVPAPALRDIDLTIGPGEMVGLVGESGAGKTTLARSIMGMVPPPGKIDAGQIAFRGQIMSSLPDNERRAILGRDLAMVIPNPRSELNPVLTVGQQIVNVLRQHTHVSQGEARATARRMLEAVRIPDPDRRLDAYPHELSGGMAQRVVIAVALSCAPRFVISDDATSGLDVTVQAQILDLLQDMVRGRSASALFITRDIAITAHFCTRIAIIYAGEIVELADTAAFFDRPMHPYSIMLLAAFSHSSELRSRWTRPQAPSQGPSRGCLFAARCVRRLPRCDIEHPTLRGNGAGHVVRCHYPVEG